MIDDLADAAAQSLADEGWAVLPRFPSSNECLDMRALWNSRDVYRYIADPLPARVAASRAGLYPQLAGIGNKWAERLGTGRMFPATQARFRAVCQTAGQVLPTPLLFRYGPAECNTLHQDLYGEHFFPLQVAIRLSEPTRDFTGGGFVLTYQRPRMQSWTAVVPMQQGHAVVFPVRERPVHCERLTLGIVFHDAAQASASPPQRPNIDQ